MGAWAGMQRRGWGWGLGIRKDFKDQTEAINRNLDIPQQF